MVKTLSNSNPVIQSWLTPHSFTHRSSATTGLHFHLRTPSPAIAIATPINGSPQLPTAITQVPCLHLQLPTVYIQVFLGTPDSETSLSKY
ncbi:hypothetical protein CR513_42608, partial [Mucuna pruriens]